MNAKSITKIILDIVMTGLFISLLFPNQTGLPYHEIIGLSILFLFALHIILNGKWIVSVTKNLLGKSKSKTLWSYFLNLFLLIGVILITITGLLISNIVLPAGGYSQSLALFHKWVSYVTAALVGTHLLLHLNYLAAMLKKIFIGLNTPIVRRTLSSAVAIIFIAGVVYYNVISMTEKNMYSSITDTTGDEHDKENNYTVSESFDKSTVTSSEPTEQTISLSEFLSKMSCSICPKHCLLSNPRCGKSAKLIQQAKTEYQELYGEL